MSPAELLARALDADPDSAERILFVVAAFDGLTDGPMILVGGGAQVTHTGVGRLTDIDLVGHLSAADEASIAGAGFARVGRHWVYESDSATIAVEVRRHADGEETPELVDVEGTIVRIISLNDLMMDRLTQATDGTITTWEEARMLATAAGDRIGWASLEERCERRARTDALLRSLPDLLARVRPDVV